MAESPPNKIRLQTTLNGFLGSEFMKEMEARSIKEGELLREILGARYKKTELISGPTHSKGWDKK